MKNSSTNTWRDGNEQTQTAGKDERALSFDEKVRVLEKLRDRDKAIAASGLKKKA